MRVRSGMRAKRSEFGTTQQPVPTDYEQHGKNCTIAPSVITARHNLISSHRYRHLSFQKMIPTFWTSDGSDLKATLMSTAVSCRSFLVEYAARSSPSFRLFVNVLCFPCNGMGNSRHLFFPTAHTTPLSTPFFHIRP